jgi:hypothetical protein
MVKPQTELVTSWRDRAAEYERDGFTEPATLLRRCADELENAWRVWWTQPLTVASAATESGYTADYLRQLVREGKVNPIRIHGTGPIHIRRCDLPKRPGAAIREAA